MDQFEQELYRLQERCVQSIFKCFGDRSQYDEWNSFLGRGRTGYCQGEFMEKAGFNISFINGDKLPPSASLHRQDLACNPYKVAGLSVIFHPTNPKIPTAHLNIRRFEVILPSGNCVVWFGGGYDLTPYIPNHSQIKLWHQTTKHYLDKFNKELYPSWKHACDEYFYLKHRNEPRGVGGVFFDDFILNSSQEETSNLVVGLADLFFNLYFETAELNKHLSFTQHEKDFQLWRRGRYVEFNLLQDRGTLFGLQSRGRTESILISLPPTTQWHYKGEERFADLNSDLLETLDIKDWILFDPIKLLQE